MRQRFETLLLERAPWFFDKKPHIWVLREFLSKLLRFEPTLEVGEYYKDLPIDQLMGDLKDKLAKKVTIKGLENLPKEGPVLVVANHPTGIGDGIIMDYVISQVRTDLRVFTNRDILKVLPQFEEFIVPVEWRADKRSVATVRQTMAAYRKTYEEGQICVIFPSGRIAKRRGITLHERAWMAGAFSFAKKFDVPILPINMQARNSWLFYLFDKVHTNLRDITLFYEMFNKGKQQFNITIGELVQPSDLPDDIEACSVIMQEKVLNLPSKDTRLPGIMQVSNLPLTAVVRDEAELRRLNA